MERGPVAGAGVDADGTLMQTSWMRKKADRDVDMVSTRRAAATPSAARNSHTLG